MRTLKIQNTNKYEYDAMNKNILWIQWKKKKKSEIEYKMVLKQMQEKKNMVSYLKKRLYKVDLELENVLEMLGDTHRAYLKLSIQFGRKYFRFVKRFGY